MRRKLICIGIAVAFLAVQSPGSILLTGAGKPAAAGGFTPFTQTFDTGTAATVAVPSGASSGRIREWGSGGSGRYTTTSGAAVNGGGGGGYSDATYAIAPADWGVNLTYTVGVGGARKTTTANGSAGTASTITGTLNVGAISQTANGGAGGTNITGAGGTASGGTNGTSVTNTTGGNGTSSTPVGNGGSSPNGGAASSFDGNAPGGGGAGENVDGPDGKGGKGADGRIRIDWT